MGDETNQAESGLARGTTRAASCPRCGYDLEGARAAWRDSCPLTGVCSECGYGFEWADVLRADRQRVRWLYEHTERWWNAWAAWRTIFVALLPWRFWSRVQLHHEPRPARLLTFAAVAIAPIWLLAISIAVLGDLIAYGAAVWRTLLGQLIRFEGDPIRVWLLVGDPFVHEFWMWTAMACSAAALCFFGTWICASEWRQGQVRGAHLARIGAYSLAPIALLFLVGITGALVSSNGYGWYWWITQSGPLPSLYRPSSWESPISSSVLQLLAWLFLLYLLWLPIWWWTALRKGLAVRRAWPLALLTVIWSFGGATIPAVIAMYLDQ